jgi:hypothetical protein
MAGDLEKRIRMARRFGWVWVAIEPRGKREEAEAIRDLLHAVGLASPQGWTRIDRRHAGRTIERFLARDLAYGGEIMPSREAASLAEEFLSQFHSEASFLTNFHEPPFDVAWDPLTDHTFDEAVVAVDHDCLGLICVADED